MRLILVSVFLLSHLTYASKKEIKDESKEKSVWVMKSDGSLSCSENPGQTLEEGAKEFQAKKIPILESKKATDGKMHVQMCGASTGAMNAYLIPKENLKEAQKQGYVEMNIAQ